ncbi:MAG: hypothetical protein JXB88_07745 [Spirochaetales bacterium]|nr:hypothetical protein [Spirochaetales bacterium]
MGEIKAKPVSNSGIDMKATGTTVYISGSINHPRPGEFMEPFIQEAHESIVTNNIQEIKVDITNLKFLNSAGIRELVDWVMKLNHLPEEKKYKIEFLCSSEHKWQESSMSTLIYLNSNYLSKVTK